MLSSRSVCGGKALYGGKQRSFLCKNEGKLRTCHYITRDGFYNSIPRVPAPAYFQLPVIRSINLALAGVAQ